MKNDYTFTVAGRSFPCFKKILIIMKLITFFLIVGLMQVSAAAYSQFLKVEFPQKDISVKDVLLTIERNSNYKFLYRNDQMDVSRLVAITSSSKTLDNVMAQVLDKTNLGYKILENNLIVITPEQQRLFVKGVVKDEKGNTLPGVTIAVKESNKVAITDANGNFSIQITPNDKTLIFSFIGMKKQEVLIDKQASMTVTLYSETSTLDEVVIVGYGAQKKVNLTGAVSAVKIDEKLASRALTNVSSGMSGLVPGLAVTQSSGMAGNDQASMVIRGLGTVNNANPLIVVDGMPDVDINRVNMNDIESISVLKDAASSAVYGSRAANGVILITTKSGKGMSKAVINFSASTSTEVPTKAYSFMADYPRALTLEQRLAAVNTLPANQTFKNGTIDQWMALGMINPLQYPNTDWWDIIMRNGQVHNYNLSASGSNDKSNFFISVGIMNQEGLQINNDYDRYNARFNYDYKVRNNMNVGIRFDGNWSKYTYALANGFTDPDASNTAGYDMQYAIAGITPYDPVTGYFGGVMAYNEDAQAYNPLVVYTNMLNRQNRQEANSSLYWDWTPIKGLTARVDYSLKYYNQFMYSANMPAQAYNFQTQAFGSRVYVGANAGIGNYTNTGYKTLLNGRLNYHTTFGKNHDLSAMFAYSEEYWYDRYQAGSRNDRLASDLHEIDAALTDIQSTGGNSSTEGLRSYIGRLNYVAYDKYLLETTFRYDGSSKFLEGSQYGFFPSAALGWRFTEENFLKPFTKSWLSSGKLRVSYGALGNNSGVGRYEQQETLSAYNYYLANATAKGLVNQKMVNPNLSWETTKVANVGLDLGFFNSRLTAEIDYYDRLTSGMNRPSSMSNLLTGAYSAPRQNIGNLRNRGIEGNFTWRDKAGDFNYSVNMNLSYNTTSLEKWNEFLSRGWIFLDMPYHFLYTYEDYGLAQTWQDVYNHTPQSASPGDILYKDLNGDGKIDGNDMKADPNIQRDRPTTNFALNATVAWKGFDLTVLFQGSTGRKDYWLNNYNSVNFTTQRYASNWSQWYNTWSVENRNASLPRLGGNNNRLESTYWLDDLSYVRLKNIQVGYALPTKWLHKLGVSTIRIYGSAENLYTLTAFRGLDPEQTGNKSDLYPLNQSFTVGLNASF
jgi:TonB-dependent starch-binding outer membrane protein SusC